MSCLTSKLHEFAIKLFSFSAQAADQHLPTFANPHSDNGLHTGSPVISVVCV